MWDIHGSSCTVTPPFSAKCVENSPNVGLYSRRRGSTFLWCEGRQQGGQAGHNQFLSKIDQRRIMRGMWLPCLIPQWLSCSTPFSRDGLSPLCGLCYGPDADTSTNCGEVCYWNGMYTSLLGEVEFQMAEILGDSGLQCHSWYSDKYMVGVAGEEKGEKLAWVGCRE